VSTIFYKNGKNFCFFVRYIGVKDQALSSNFIFPYGNEVWRSFR